MNQKVCHKNESPPCLGHPLLAISALHAHSVDAVALLGLAAHLPSLAELNDDISAVSLVRMERKTAGKGAINIHEKEIYSIKESKVKECIMFIEYKYGSMI